LESSELDSSIANDISIGAESEKVFLNSPNYQNAQVLKKRYMNAYKIIETASKDNDLSSETLNIADKMRERSLKISSEIAFSHNPLKTTMPTPIASEKLVLANLLMILEDLCLLMLFLTHIII